MAWQNKLKVWIEPEKDMYALFFKSYTDFIEKGIFEDYQLLICDIELISLDEQEPIYRRDRPIITSISNHKSPKIKQLMKLGISGIVYKTATSAQLLRTIRNALDGLATLPMELFQSLHTIPEYDDILISPKELSILEGLALGKSNKELATLLYVSQRTVEYHLTHIFSKFNVHTRTEAVMAAKSKGIIHV
ncbi:response regulator transcription factor [Paenibacillus polymyxa]|uniref:response regulator transcription factor n=1 Tax=Paenibacillus polymyxa TaxID=1406 RepID=UPI00298BDB53|nr:response regulator transcription factor [Paenibacillus polymyxa]